MPEYGFDILDLHYHLRHQLQRRADDGVHWDQTAHRRISNLILGHIAMAWGVKPKGMFSNIAGIHNNLCIGDKFLSNLPLKHQQIAFQFIF